MKKKILPLFCLSVTALTLPSCVKHKTSSSEEESSTIQSSETVSSSAMIDGSTLESIFSSSSKSSSSSTIPAPVNKYYLPMRIVENDYDYNFTTETTYVYDDDLLGYTETSISTEGDSREKAVISFRFNEDFTQYTYIKKMYNAVNSANYTLLGGEKEEIALGENGSYQCLCYDLDPETNVYMPTKDKTKVFDAYGRELLAITKKYDEEEKIWYYTNYEIFAYNEQGYQTKYESRGYLDDTVIEDDAMGIDAYTTFEYNNDFTHCSSKEYFFNYDMQDYEHIYTTEIDIENKDGVRTYDEQMYIENGKDGKREEGNHNVFKYDSKFRRIYEEYGGVKEKSEYTYNSYDQIAKLHYEEDLYLHCVQDFEATYQPNGGNILSITNTVDYTEDCVSLEVGEFKYNSNNQITDAKQVRTYKDAEGKTPEGYKDSYVQDFKVTYSLRQNDELLARMDWFQYIVEVVSSHVIEESVLYY